MKTKIRSTGKIKNLQLIIIFLVLTIISLVVYYNFLSIPQTSATQHRYAVSVTTSSSEEVLKKRYIALYGAAEAKKRIKLKSTINGVVTRIAIKEGDYLKKGDLLMQIAYEKKQIIHNQARALLLQRKIQYENAQKSRAKKLISQADLTLAQAKYDEAQANLAKAEIELMNSNITAPFDGHVNKLLVEEGYVVEAFTSELVDYIDYNTLVIKAPVSALRSEQIKVGMQARVKFLHDIEKQALVTSISHAADPQTRSFMIEIAVPNIDALLKDGAMAEVFIQTGQVPVHKILPTSLSYDAVGQIGLHVVDEQNKVAFHPVIILEEEGDYLYVGGVPAQLQIITTSNKPIHIGDVVEIKESK